MARFSYTTWTNPTGTRLIRPIVPVELEGGTRITADALIDTGADANVMPYQLGINLGLAWDQARPVPSVYGNFERTEARAVILSATLHTFDPARLIFIWLKTDAVRLLLGQVNFFQEFNVCFFASEGYFEIGTKN